LPLALMIGSTLHRTWKQHEAVKRKDEALEFYAAEEPDRCTMVIGHSFTGYSDVFAQFEPAVIDQGEKARAAFAEVLAE
jgi:hypothetical protein